MWCYKVLVTQRGGGCVHISGRVTHESYSSDVEPPVQPFCSNRALELINRLLLMFIGVQEGL